MDWGVRLPGLIRGAMAFLARHFRRIANWWSARLRFLWRGPGAGARMAAIGLFLAGLAALVVGSSIAGYRLGLRLPLVSGHVDAHLNSRLAKLLDSYGHADFVTDAAEWA